MRWWDVYGQEAKATATGECWTADAAAADKYGLQAVESAHDVGLCTKPGKVHLGGNSGYQAMGLAYMWGAAKIALLGFDFQRTYGKSHCHGDHEGGLPNLIDDMKGWVQRMVQMGIDLRGQGVQVINASRETAIACFERMPIAEALGVAKPVLWVQGMQGLGDNIYQRAVIREVAKTHDVYLQTPWPQLVSDLPVRCVPSPTKLRTQAKNVARGGPWANQPQGVEPIRPHYVNREGSMLRALCEAYGIAPDALTFDIPQFPRVERAPYIVIRPVTVRREWPDETRNPRPEYLARAADRLREHFRIVSVADLAGDAEWAVQPLPYADETFHRGELPVEELLALVAGAAGVVAGVGWAVPAAVATQVPLFLVYGGHGKHNGPDRIFDPLMPTENIHQAIPQRFCMCANFTHDCDKRIDDFDEHLERFVLGLLARQSAAMAAGSRDRLLPGIGAAV